MASMMINGWDTSATRRLLQCRDWQLGMMNIWRLFEGPGVNPDAPDGPVMFQEKRKVVDEVKKLNKKYSTTYMPILYDFEVSGPY